MVLDDLPVVDSHAHPVLADAARLGPLGLRPHFSESPDPEQLAQHAEHSLFYQRALRDLAHLLGCEPVEEAVLARRAELGLATYCSLLAGAARLEAVLLDDGYPPQGGCSVAQMGEMLATRVYRVLRLEQLEGDLVARHAAFEDFEEAFRAELRDLRARGTWGLKSIAAYRTGLAVGPADRLAAAGAWALLRRRAEAGEPVRVASKPLVDYCVHLGLEQAARQGLPFQFHTGFGDVDLDLLRANPLLLKPLLEEPRYRGATIVLLHASLPYTVEASYLASLYGHVYLDLSLAIPYALPLAPDLLARALSLAPTTKVLYGSDAHGIPDLYYLAALHFRRALATFLDDLLARDAITASQADAIAIRLLADNARRCYGLPAS